MAEAKNNGYLTVDQVLENAPADIVEADVEVWGGKVRVRGLTAAQSARIGQECLNADPRATVTVDVAKMARLQFEAGVVEPKFDADKVRSLHLSAGVGFQTVVDKIEELSGTTAEEWKKAQAAFQGSGE